MGENALQFPVVMQEEDDEPRVSLSHFVAPLGVDYYSLSKLVRNHRTRFEALGFLRFQIQKITEGRGRATKTPMLTEDQAYLLVQLTRNTEQAVDIKLALTMAFRDARHAINSSVLIDRDLWNHAIAVERDAAAAKARAELAGSILSHYRHHEKPRVLKAFADLREALQLVLPWGHKP
jgi:hypothetical protein